MEVLGNVVVTPPISSRTLSACTAIAASVLLLTSCSQDSDGRSDGRATPSEQSAAPSPTTSPPSEKVLMKRAAAIVASISGGSLLEGGSERVVDGIHTRPELGKGKTYRLVVTCVGRGNAHLTIAPTTSGSDAPVPCDQSVVQQRIKGDDEVRIDVSGAKGSTGVLAWQINIL